ncbi:HLA class II histocompatibility antigen gamma chain isoform X2 [Balearica regulorum gibbericeps]|uniref:HLA class II histocompatibility antigen gamma chain isoform X2 n=1 Tax=Balearica regulorum gibbericeps TaxID=100784 RepID=UPI003F5F867C
MAEEQRDLISDRGSGVLNVRDTQRSALGRKAAFSTLSILVALLIAGQAVTVYFVYQQSGQISKLTKTSQTLQLEALQRKLPASAKPVNKMKMAMVSMPMAMKVLPLAPSTGNTVMAPTSNRTEDQVKHVLLQADPRKKFPELKDNLLDNLKNLKNTMTDTDWKSFESWMQKWLLFEMAKNPKQEERKTIPAEKDATAMEPEDMIFSGVDMLKLGAEKGERLGGHRPRHHGSTKSLLGQRRVGMETGQSSLSCGRARSHLTDSFLSFPHNSQLEEDTADTRPLFSIPAPVFYFFCSISFLLLHCLPKMINSGHPRTLLPLEASVATLLLLQGTRRG